MKRLFNLQTDPISYDYDVFFSSASTSGAGFAVGTNMRYEITLQSFTATKITVAAANAITFEPWATLRTINLTNENVVVQTKVYTVVGTSSTLQHTFTTTFTNSVFPTGAEGQTKGLVSQGTNGSRTFVVALQFVLKKINKPVVIDVNDHGVALINRQNMTIPHYFRHLKRGRYFY